MNIYVYEPAFSEVEERIKDAYIRSVRRNDEVDEEFKSSIKRDQIKVAVKWAFRYTANFDYLTVKVKGQHKISGSIEQAINQGPIATIRTDSGTIYANKRGELSQEKFATSSTRHFSETVDFTELYEFKSQSNRKSYPVSYGDLPPEGTVEACVKHKIKSLSEMPDYVDPLIKEIRLKYFDIFSHKDAFDDFCFEQKVFEEQLPFKHWNIKYCNVIDVPDYSIKSESVIVYPIFSLEIKYKRKTYHVDEINIDTFKISTYENHTAPRSIGYNQAKKNYFLARTTSVLLFVCSFLTTLLLFIGIEQTADGWEQAVLVLKLVLETITAIALFFLFRNDPLINNDETSYEYSAKLTWTYVKIYFVAFVVIDGIVALAHFLF